MFFRLVGCSVLCVWLTSASGQLVNPAPGNPTQTNSPGYALNRFDNAIRTFEKQDSVTGIPGNRIVFIGSSSFAFWQSMSVDLAPLPVLNRGFGGSTLPEVSHYADRILFPYQPRIIVVYAGENDLNVGPHPQTPEQVAASFRTFVRGVQRRLPKTIIYFVSMKPSPARWANWPVTQRGNQLIEAYVKTDKRLRFIDVRPAMLGPDGRPRPEIFKADSLHMNAAGYAVWAGLIKPILLSETRNKVIRQV
ncbi:MAG: hypothetical protein H7Z72_22825, partial [Bacteroidetes bacterium]|nr:hypothetical protein [Fibrella sp.]